MDAVTINRWVGNLGRNYDELVTEGVISNQPLKPMFDSSDNEDLLQNPTAGVKLWFSVKAKCLEKVMITLVQTVGQPVYAGELPAPFTLNMDQTYSESPEKLCRYCHSRACSSEIQRNLRLA